MRSPLYKVSTTDPGCAISSVDVILDVTFFLPKWNIPPNASPLLIEAWNNYVSGPLQTHENGHKDIAVAAANEIQSTLESFSPYPSCEALIAEANSTIQSINNRAQELQVKYDQDTQSGRTQGGFMPL